jgi:hypothetical protein
MSRNAAPVWFPCPFKADDRVEVREQGIRPWYGVVISVKWSAVSGWWLDVERDDSDRAVWVVQAVLARVVVMSG